MTANMEIPITIETRDHLLEDVIATVEVDIEVYELQPYSWGGSRDTATACNSARIVSVQLGGHNMPRAALVEWIGETEVSRQETRACDLVNEMPLDFLREAAE